MKKSLGVLFIAASILAACNNADVEENNEPIVSDEQADEVENEQPETEAEAEPSDSDAAEIEGEQEKNENSTEVSDEADSIFNADLPEYEKVSSTIDVDDYSVEQATDNEGERIFLFSDENGEKKYKSIFIKHDQRLKIIQLDGDGQILNEKLS